MDKLRVLLSAGAMLGLVAGTAHAGRILDMDGNPATVTGTGLAVGVDGFPEMGGPYTGGQGLETESAVPWSVPQPGKVNMRVNVFVNEFPMAAWWTGMSGTSSIAGTVGNKQQPYGIYGWIRLDFGIDAMTKTGVKYGGYVQIRENNTTAISGGTASIAAGNFTAGAAGHRPRRFQRHLGLRAKRLVRLERQHPLRPPRQRLSRHRSARLPPHRHRPWLADAV